ncbi:MAG: hypothetical protein ACTHM9_14800 [Gemmatimonadales bacterium]
MSPTLRISVLVALLATAGRVAAAQTDTGSASPTLPSDTLQANFAPRSSVGPTPELAPTLPSDTLEVAVPSDSAPADSFGSDSTSSDVGRDDFLPEATPETPGDSAAVRALRTWIQRHPDLLGPPPERAILAKV